MNDIAIIKNEIDVIILEMTNLEKYLSEELLDNSGHAITNLKSEVTKAREKLASLITEIDSANSTMQSNYVSSSAGNN